MIKIEYGSYDKNMEGDYDSQIHYFIGTNELRFIQINHNDLEKNSEDYFLLSCQIKNKMTVIDLLNQTQISRHFHIWDKENYNLFGQNCQLFVRKAIQVLGAYRDNEYYKNRFMMKALLPFRIINALEDNEKEFDIQESFIERIPILGQIYDIMKISKFYDQREVKL